jgi:hypothetical protein
MTNVQLPMTKGRHMAVTLVIGYLVIGPSLGIWSLGFGYFSSGAKPSSEERAIAFLAKEVPRWSRENKCFSCHNNGDAARALYTAHRLKFPLPPQTLDDTSAWLVKPHGWHINGGDVEYKDECLSRIQFAAALVEAMDAGLVKDRQPLLKAAELVAAKQGNDGAWQGEFPGDVGSPVTYGIPLATVQARRVLQRADAARYLPVIRKAEAYLLQAPVKRVVDAAAVLWGLDGMAGEQAAAKRRECLETIRKGQGKDGGWGPYINSPPEVFDTALVMIAACRLGTEKEMVQRGRAYLIAQQKADGSWPETTRPGGGDSYAQRLSTAGWATLALLATR